MTELTQKERELLHEILTTNWLYDKLEESIAFKDKMLNIDVIISKLADKPEPKPTLAERRKQQDEDSAQLRADLKSFLQEEG